MYEPLYGLLALFPDGQSLLEAIPRVRQEGYTNLEAYTPYPVHGLDEALGLRKSMLGVLVFVLAALGAVLVFLFEWWTSTVSYPLLTAGKPYNGWPAWVPVTVEGTILVGTFTAALGMLFVFNKLPHFGNPMLRSRAIDSITRDRFALVLRPVEGELDIPAATAVLEALGGEALEVVSLPRHEPPGPTWWAGVAAATALACVFAGYGTAWAIRTFPTTKPMLAMESQPRLDPEEPDTFFANGRGMQLPPDGTVPRTFMPILATTPADGGRALIDPLPVTARVLERGRRMFDLHCAVCHDRLGTGQTWLDSTYQAQPTDLQSTTVREAADGYLYWVISKGFGSMPSYAADISPDDRWAIVRYVRALERSQDAPERDLK